MKEVYRSVSTNGELSRSITRAVYLRSFFHLPGIVH